MPPRWDLIPGLIVAVSVALVGLLVLSARLRHRPNQLFALFLFLVAGNFLAGFMVPLVGAQYDSTHPYSWLGYLFLILDPGVLAYFISIYPTRSFLASHRWATLGLFAVPALLVAVHLLDPSRLVAPSPNPWRWTLFTYLAAAYLYCLLRLVWLASHTTTALLRQQVGILLAAFGVALVPRFGILVVDLGLFENPRSLDALLAKMLLAGMVLATVAALGVLLTRPADRPRFLTTMAVVASFLVLIGAVWILDYRTGSSANLFFVHLGYGGRWIVFAGLVTAALMRYQLLDFRLRLVDAFAIAVAFVGVSLILFLLPAYVVPLGPDQALRPSAPDMIAFVLGALGIATAPILLRAFLTRQKSDVRSGDRWRGRRQDAYRAVLEVMHAEGRGTSDQEELRVLRRNLGISVREHDRLATLIRWQASSAHARGLAGSVSPIVERYDVRRPLGEGTWGQAYLARDRLTGTDVVLKRLHQSAVDDPAARKALLAEAQVLQGIDHPNVVRLIQVWEDPEPVLVLEFVEGGSLDRLLAEHGRRRSLQDAQRIFGDVLAGIDELHRHGVVHRDLKPNNILLTRDGRAKIGDFGVALPANLRRTLQSSQRASKPVGTILYMSPEQAAGHQGDAQSDLWAVGATLHEFLTGRPPVDLEGRSEVEALTMLAQGRFSMKLDGFPEPLSRFFRRAFAKRRTDRFDSAKEMGIALTRLSAANQKSDPVSLPPRYP